MVCTEMYIFRLNFYFVIKVKLKYSKFLPFIQHRYLETNKQNVDKILKHKIDQNRL